MWISTTRWAREVNDKTTKSSANCSWWCTLMCRYSHITHHLQLCVQVHRDENHLQEELQVVFFCILCLFFPNTLVFIIHLKKKSLIVPPIFRVIRVSSHLSITFRSPPKSPLHPPHWHSWLSHIQRAWVTARALWYDPTLLWWDLVLHNIARQNKNRRVSAFQHHPVWDLNDH